MTEIAICKAAVANAEGLYERSGYTIFKKEIISGTVWFVFMEKI